MKINYHPKLKELARKLRNKSTKSEIKRYNEKYGWGFTSDSMLYCRLRKTEETHPRPLFLEGRVKDTPQVIV